MPTPESKPPDPNLHLRTIAIGACATLSRAAEMGCPGAAEMCDELRRAVLAAIKGAAVAAHLEEQA